MNKIMKCSIVFAAAALVCLSCAMTPVTPADRLLACLEASVDAGKILYGHQDDLCYGHSWCVEDPANDPLERSDVKEVCGKYPAVLGLELGEIELGGEKSLDAVPFELIRRSALKQVERGGVVTFSWHPRNPLTGDSAWDTSSDKVVDLNFVSWITAKKALAGEPLYMEDIAQRTDCKTNETFIADNVMDYTYTFGDVFSNQQRARTRHVLKYGPAVPGPKLIDYVMSPVTTRSSGKPSASRPTRARPCPKIPSVGKIVSQ